MLVDPLIIIKERPFPPAFAREADFAPGNYNFLPTASKIH